MCEITAVTSGKGGSGKTMFAANMACILAMSGKKILLIDMNTGLRNLDICLGMENQVIYDLEDVITGICTISKALIKDRRFEALYLLSSSQIYDKAEIKPLQMKKLCEQLSQRFDHIIIDTPSGIGSEWKASIEAANRAVVVLTQDYVSVRDADTVDTRLRNSGIAKRYAVVNKVRSEYAASGFFPPLGEISESLRMQIAGVIQDDMNIHIAMNKGVPVVCKKDTYIERNFQKIVSRILAEREDFIRQ